MSHEYLERGRFDGYAPEYARQPPADDGYDCHEHGGVARPMDDYGRPQAFEQALSHHHHQRAYDAPHHHEAYRASASSSHYDSHYDQLPQYDRREQYEPYSESRAVGYHEQLPPRAPAKAPPPLSWDSRLRSRERVNDLRQAPSIQTPSPHARRSQSRERSSDSRPPPQETTPSLSSRSRSTDRSSVSRKSISLCEALYVKKYVDLEEYREEYLQFKYVHLKREDRLRMFGSEYMPIFMPLARGETPREYKERFIKWLEKKGYTFEQVHNDRDIWLERNLWIKFGNANVQSIERYEPPASASKRKRSPGQDDRSRSPSRRRIDKKEEAKPTTEKSKPSVKSKPVAITSEKARDKTGAASPRQSCSFKKHSASTPTEDVMAAHLQCGCTSCLFGAMMKMAEKVAELEDVTTKTSTPSKPPPVRSNEVIDLTKDESASSPRRPPRRSIH